ncbi:MAG TPA: GTPase HflX [Polyangia bacterium]|jgi:GTP-binding protein HflX|nr:GTPase HflX [Polyangia bacterium]
MELVTGHIQGLKPSQLHMLERIARRRVDPSAVVSPELATFLCQCSQETDRQVGVLLDRRGNVNHVVVGDAHKLFLPDLGRLRAGQGRFRGLRLVHTHLRSEPITRDDFVDLAKLRLDLVAVVGMRPDGSPGQLLCAHLLPDNPQGELWRELDPVPATAAGIGDIDFTALMASLEEEFAAHAIAAREVPGVEGGFDRAVLVHVSLGRMQDGEERVAELRELCRTAGVRVMDTVIQRRPAPDPKFLLGKGKLEEIVLRAMQRDAELLIFDPELTPAQARAISDLTELKVIDRTMLILDIFAQHATTRDGKLQVELAQLKYALPRLVEKNTMMSRLTGGIGGRGPGETKLEVSRRRAREKIQLYERQIRELGRRREQRRALRTSREVPIVAIVGYTNAGKSTLLNTLTKGDVLAENKLFATLDPTSRRLRFPREREVVLTDTVGFIRDLPKDLVNAFRATLEELDDADLLLHIVDVADPAHEAQIRAVERILGDLKLQNKPRLLVFNKADRLPQGEAERIASGFGGLAIAACDAGTTTLLLQQVERMLWKEQRRAATDPGAAEVEEGTARAEMRADGEDALELDTAG